MDKKDFVELAKRIDIDNTAASSMRELQNYRSSDFRVSDFSGMGRPPSRRARARESIHMLQSILQESPQMSLTLADVAQLLNLERTYCCKVFQEITGSTFLEWVRRIRIARAQRLLRLSSYTITEVSHAAGYDDITTFSRNFRKELGLSPRSFRQLVVKPIE